MSSKTKIVVLHMKEIIYTVLFICLGILLVALLTFMFPPEKQRNFLIKEHFLSTGHLHFTAYFGR